MSTILDSLFALVTRDDFVLKKEYRVVESVANFYGKWPQYFTSGLFLDSTFLLQNTVDMVYQNLMVLIQRNGVGFAISGARVY
jgi:hypothetical protein